jgi:hypothetical protein
MLRSGDSIRLTSKELQTFREVVADGGAAPTSAEEHDARLDAAASTWRLADTAEGQLLASIALDLKLEHTRAPSGGRPALELVINEQEQLRNDFGLHWGVDASGLPLPEMLAMAEAEVAKHRRDFPSAAAMYEKFNHDIRLQMDTDME